MAESFAPGKWELEKSENFDDYMKALGVGLATRLVGNRAKPKQEIAIKDGTWTITTSSTVTKTVINFQPGVEFDEATADGRKVKTTCTIDGNTLISEQKGTPDSTITREFTQDAFVMTLKAKDVTCVRHYKRAA